MKRAARYLGRSTCWSPRGWRGRWGWRRRGGGRRGWGRCGRRCGRRSGGRRPWASWGLAARSPRRRRRLRRRHCRRRCRCRYWRWWCSSCSATAGSASSPPPPSLSPLLLLKPSRPDEHSHAPTTRLTDAAAMAARPDPALPPAKPAIKRGGGSILLLLIDCFHYGTTPWFLGLRIKRIRGGFSSSASSWARLDSVPRGS